MAGVGTLILAADYNGIQSKIAGILGSGSGTSGYGQSVSSAQVAVGDPIRASQWSALRNDLLRARQHQTGVDESGNLTAIIQGQTVAANSIEVQYDTFATTVITNKLSVAANQGTVENVITPTTRTSAWNGTRTNEITISFSDANHARYFFNGGGNFQISSSRNGGSSSSKNSTWSTMLSDGGTVTMNYTTTSSTGNGTVYNVGFYSLTTNYQLIYNKDAPSGSYSENKYQIYAKTNAGATQVIFSVQYQDLDTGGDQTGNFGPPPYGPGVDEDVDGNLTNTVSMFRPSGSNVSVSAPSATQTGIV